MNRPGILALVVFLCALAAALVWMPAFAPVTAETSANQSEARRVLPMPCDGSLDSAVVPAVPALSACSISESPEEFLAAKAGRFGYCKCGCGARCQTSADCGGSACVSFITCC